MGKKYWLGDKITSKDRVIYLDEVNDIEKLADLLIEQGWLGQIICIKGKQGEVCTDKGITVGAELNLCLGDKIRDKIKIAYCISDISRQILIRFTYRIGDFVYVGSNRRRCELSYYRRLHKAKKEVLAGFGLAKESFRQKWEDITAR